MRISVVQKAVFTLAAPAAAFIFALSSPAQIQNPIKAAKDAYNKARQDQQQKQQPTRQPTQAQQPAQQTPQAGATPDPVAATPGTAEPWTPPAETPNAPVVLDPSKMPDVIGVRLGMTAQEALETMRKQYPKDIYQKLTADWWPSVQKPDYGYTVLSSAPGNYPNAHLSFTALPNPQLVWRITRLTQRMHINRATFLAALREKYGKETVAYPENGGGPPVSDDRRMGELVWLFDERGGRAPIPRGATLPGADSLVQCLGRVNNPQPMMPVDDVELTRQFKDWCASVVGMHINIGSQEIVENTFTEMVDVPLAIRTAHAAAVWQRDLAERLRREDLEKSKKAKPVL